MNVARPLLVPKEEREKLSLSKLFAQSFLKGWYSDDPDHMRTIENLTALLSLRSLENPEERREYGKYLEELEAHLFTLSPQELATVELSLPPYSEIVNYVYRKVGVTEEELKNLQELQRILRRRIFRVPVINLLAFGSLKLISLFKKDLREVVNVEKKINERILSFVGEYREILDRRTIRLLRDSILLYSPLYLITGALHLLRTGDPTVGIAYASSISSLNALSYLSIRIKSKKWKERIPYLQLLPTSLAGTYICYRSLDPLLIGMYFLNVLPSWILYAPALHLIPKAVEKLWPFLPRTIRRAIAKSRRWLAGIKVREFNEKEILKELYEASSRLKKVSSLPSYVFEEFERRLKLGVIRVENPEEECFFPYALGYCRREIILLAENGVQPMEGKEKVLEEIAKAYGVTVDDVIKEPWKYLEMCMYVDPKDGRKKICYGRSVIGMYNFENPVLRKGIAAKEVAASALSIYATSLFLERRE